MAFLVIFSRINVSDSDVQTDGQTNIVYVHAQLIRKPLEYC